MLSATLQEPLPLQVFVPDGRTNLFIRVHLYSAAGALLSTLALTHQTDGLYSVNWTPTSEGYFTALYEFFEDGLYSVPADYDRSAEQIEVNENKTNILRMLGLQHHNAILDQQVYNVRNQLISARLRAWDTAGSVGTAAPPEFAWQLTFTYDVNGRLTEFKRVQV